MYNIKFIVVTKFESVFKERNNENLITENLKYFVMYVGYHTLVKKNYDFKLLFVFRKLNCEKESLAEVWKRKTFQNYKSAVNKLHVIVLLYLVCLTLSDILSK